MKRVFGSFRDTAGQVYLREGDVVRTVSKTYASHFEAFLGSGLCDELVSAGDLISFSESAQEIPDTWKTLEVERVPFFSYPYEWSFEQLRDAALLTLKVHMACLRKGMVLKDASAYNITMHRGRQIFVDLLSFETWTEGKPWQGYRQFCSHFLAPLLLMSQVDVRLSQLMRTGVDGIPLDLASRVLPMRSLLHVPTFLHIHLHAWAQKRYGDNSASADRATAIALSRTRLMNIAEQLFQTVEGIKAPSSRTVWGDYYSECTYTDAATKEKLRIVQEMVRSLGSRVVVDLGANNGFYSRAVAPFVDQVVSTDFDHRAVDANYSLNRANKLTNVLPLVLDLANPTGGIGWGGKERPSFKERASFDLALALAVIHHLAITAGIPFSLIAEEFSTLGRDLIVEWVPPDDIQVRRISAMNPGILAGYSYEAFIAAFSAYYEHVRVESLGESGRSLHLFRKKI